MVAGLSIKSQQSGVSVAVATLLQKNQLQNYRVTAALEMESNERP